MTVSRRDSLQQAVYETERRMWVVFGDERMPWEMLTVDERETYGLRLLALTVADRWEVGGG